MPVKKNNFCFLLWAQKHLKEIFLPARLSRSFKRSNKINPDMPVKKNNFCFLLWAQKHLKEIFLPARLSRSFSYAMIEL